MRKRLIGLVGAALLALAAGTSTASATTWSFNVYFYTIWYQQVVGEAHVDCNGNITMLWGARTEIYYMTDYTACS